jgi:hypothetical protein
VTADVRRRIAKRKGLSNVERGPNDTTSSAPMAIVALIYKRADNGRDRMSSFQFSLKNPIPPRYG